MQLSSLQTGLLEQHRRRIHLQFVNTTQYTIAKQSPVGMLVACMQLYLRASVHACLSTYTLHSLSLPV